MQQLSALLQFLVLSRLKLRLLDFGDLVLQGLHPPELFAFIHGHPVDFPAKFENGGVFFLIIRQKRGIVPEGIQKPQMVLFIKEGRRIVLAVDIDQLDSQFMEDGHRHETAVHPADVFPIQVYIPLDHRLLVVLHPVFLEPAKLRHLGKDPPDRSLGGAGADHVPISPLPHNGGNGIDDDGFTGTGLAGEHVESLVKGDVRLLDHRDIFNMQKAQQDFFSPYCLTTALISPLKAAAELASRMTIITVSSPARVPRTTLIFIASNAAPAAFAIPARVWITMMFSA